MENVEKKNNLPVIICFVIGIILIVVSLVLLITSGNKDKKEEKKEDASTEIKLTDKEKEKLLSYIPESFPYSKDNHYSAYGEDKILVKDMDTNWLVYTAMQYVTEKGECTTELFNLNGLCDFTLKVSDVEKAIKSIYGNINITYPEKVKNNFLWGCTKKDDLYACSNSGGGYLSNSVTEYFGLYGTRTFAKVESAKKDGNNLVLDVTYARFEFVYDSANDDLKAEDLTFRILKYGVGDALVDDTILSGKDYYNSDKKFIDQIYNEYKDKLAKYKVTYSIDGSNYKLVSVDPV